MKHLFTLIFIFLVSAKLFAQSQICNPAGNLIIYSNYDGGTLNIMVDQNIPDLKIGVVSYEPVSVVVSGLFASNVTGAIFAGYPSNGGGNCGSSSPTGISSISGVNSSVISIQNSPLVNLQNSNGYGSIVCAYSCNLNSSQGGCNTVDQIVAYFQSQFQGSSLRYHQVQYNCWLQTETRAVSQGGNCCLVPQALPIAGFEISSDTICEETCVSFTDTSINNPTGWNWVFQGGTPSTSNLQNPQNICFSTAGNYTINLSVSNGAGTSSLNRPLFVKPKPVFINQPLSATSNPGNSHQFTTTLSGSNQQLQWQMNSGSGYSDLANGGQFSGVTTSTLTVGNITMANHNQMFRCVAVQNGCADTSETAVLNVLDNTGEEELTKHGIYIHPNPFSKLLQIQSENQDRRSVQIMDITGKIIFHTQLDFGKQMIDLGFLKAGVYLLRIPEINGAHQRLIKYE